MTGITSETFMFMVKGLQGMEWSANVNSFQDHSLDKKGFLSLIIIITTTITTTTIIIIMIFFNVVYNIDRACARSDWSKTYVLSEYKT